MINNEYGKTRLYTENIQDMYYGTKESKRGYIGGLVKLIPWINTEFNILCSNPQETDESKLNLLTWEDITRICGYKDVKNFKKNILDLKIKGYDAVKCLIHGRGMAIYINPKFCYSSDNIASLYSLYALFNMEPNK